MVDPQELDVVPQRGERGDIESVQQLLSVSCVLLQVVQGEEDDVMSGLSKLFDIGKTST